jgi:Glycosyl transferase family 2
MSTPLVSVVINNFNYAQYLPRSIESALSQTHPRLEVVVVDDVSTDGSRDVIARYAKRTVPVLREKNGGQGAAVNAGFRASHGDIVFFLDADDYLYPHAVAHVVSAWVGGLSKVQFRLDLVDVDGRKIDTFPPPEVAFDSGDVVPRLLATGRYQTTVMSGNAFSRAALEKVLPMPEADFRISADGYLVTVTPFYGPVASLEEPLGAYRQHGANAWSVGSTAPSAMALAERLRRTLLHDVLKYQTLDARARQFGMQAAPNPGLRDTQHLAARIGSLCLDPAHHVQPGESRLSLGLKGALTSGRARLSWKRRATLASWFLAVGFLPRPAASRAAAWFLAPGSRPPAVARVLKAVRRLLRPRAQGA